MPRTRRRVRVVARLSSSCLLTIDASDGRPELSSAQRSTQDAFAGRGFDRLQLISPTTPTHLRIGS